MSGAKVIGALVALAALVVGAPLAGMALAERGDSRSPVAPGPSGDAGAPERPPADAGPAESSTAPEDFVAVLLPPQMAGLSPRIEETVLDVPVKVGQRVRKGDIIVAFDLRLPKRELAIAEAQLREMRAAAAAASSELAAARSKAARRTATVDVGGKSVPLVSTEEAALAHFDALGAEARAASASARIAETSGKIDQLRLALQENELTAPFDGVVSAVNFEPGMSVRVGDVVARVVGGRGLRVRVAVSEESAAALAAARRVRVVVDDRVLYATLEQVPPEPEPASRSFLVEGSVEDFDHACPGGCAELVGRTARASLVGEPRGGAEP